jgi:hypothetical protein
MEKNMHGKCLLLFYLSEGRREIDFALKKYRALYLIPSSSMLMYGNPDYMPK